MALPATTALPQPFPLLAASNNNAATNDLAAASSAQPASIFGFTSTTNSLLAYTYMDPYVEFEDFTFQRFFGEIS